MQHDSQTRSRIRAQHEQLLCAGEHVEVLRFLAALIHVLEQRVSPHELQTRSCLDRRAHDASRATVVQTATGCIPDRLRSTA